MKGLRGALRQPLPYFVLLGVVVFLVDFWLRRASDAVGDPAGVRREVASSLQKTLSRPPTDAELQRGLEQWVDKELLFREALALKLDENDSVIRDHLAQKLEHIVRERTVLEAPTEAELRARLAAHPKRYTAPKTFDVTHAFVLRASSPETYQARVDEVVTRLAGGAKPETVGDHFPRGPKFTGMTRPQLERIFEAKLSAALDVHRIGQWQSVPSPRGTHLLRLDAVNDGKPDFEALRAVLTADVQDQKKRAAESSYLKELRKKYHFDSRSLH